MMQKSTDITKRVAVDTDSDSDNSQKAAASKRQKVNSKPKIRHYLESYVDFGLTFVGSNENQQTKCLICSGIFSNSLMVPRKLKRHLQTKHASYATKDRFFYDC